MMFMNEYDIEDARRQFSGDPVMEAATTTLYNLMNWTNRNSDGWAYWNKPLRAATGLMTLIQEVQRNRRSYYGFDGPDAPAEFARYKKSLSAIKAFRTRQNADFEILEVK